MMNLDQLFFFLPKIPESIRFEMVILYGLVCVFVYVLLCPWTTDVLFHNKTPYTVQF